MLETEGNLPSFIEIYKTKHEISHRFRTFCYKAREYFFNCKHRTSNLFLSSKIRRKGTYNFGGWTFIAKAAAGPTPAAKTTTYSAATIPATSKSAASATPQRSHRSPIRKLFVYNNGWPGNIMAYWHSEALAFYFGAEVTRSCVRMHVAESFIFVLRKKN